jgi:MinD superfamily P-loop ATPase
VRVRREVAAGTGQQALAVDGAAGRGCEQNIKIWDVDTEMVVAEVKSIGFNVSMVQWYALVFRWFSPGGLLIERESYKHDTSLRVCC